MKTTRVRMLAWTGLLLWVQHVAIGKLTPEEWMRFMRDAANAELEGRTTPLTNLCRELGVRAAQQTGAGSFVDRTAKSSDGETGT